MTSYFADWKSSSWHERLTEADEAPEGEVEKGTEQGLGVSQSADSSSKDDASRAEAGIQMIQSPFERPAASILRQS